MLYSEGYATAKALSTKVVSLFTLSKQLLSAAALRVGSGALKAILNTAGKFLAQARESQEDERRCHVEAETLIKAVRVNTLSKLTLRTRNDF